MNKNASQKGNVWLSSGQVSVKPRLRLYCFPYAGGSASVFRNWQHYFDDIEIAAVQYPGRASRFNEALIDSMDEMVDGLFRGLEESFTEMPFAFFGHSMGASIAFELSRKLAETASLVPELLIVSGRRAPSVPRESQDEFMYRLDKPAFIEKLEKLNGTPEELLENDDLMELMEPILRNDFKLVETFDYKPGPELAVPIHVISGEHDQHVNSGNIEPWANETRCGCGFSSLPGDHFFLHSHEADLIKQIKELLSSVI